MGILRITRSPEIKWAQKSAPREEARSLSYIETEGVFGLLLFLLLSVASLDASIAQADEIFAVFIGLKTEFQ